MTIKLELLPFIFLPYLTIRVLLCTSLSPNVLILDFLYALSSLKLIIYLKITRVYSHYGFFYYLETTQPHQSFVIASLAKAQLLFMVLNVLD